MESKWRMTRAKTKTMGLAGKIFLTLFLGVFFAIGLGAFIMLGGGFLKEAQTRFWPKVECRILNSEASREAPRSRNPYRVAIRYEYPYEGRTYQSDQVRLGGLSYQDYGKAQEVADRYPAGSTVEGFVNPADPTEAYLMHTSLGFAVFLLIPFVFMLVGGGGVVAVWLGKWDSASKTTPSSGPVSARAAKGGVGCLVIFFGIFFVVGMGFFYHFFIRPLWMISSARNWVEVPCMVESSEVVRHTGDDGPTYSIDILYRYEHGGKEYRSSRYQFMSASSSGRKGKQEVVRRYPVGRQTVCYVNPKLPSQAVLNRGFTPDMWFGLIPLVFVLVGLLGVVFTVRTANKKARRASSVRRTSAMDMSRPGTPRAVPSQSGPLELKVKSSPWGKLIAMSFFALFWNGIVGVFVGVVINAWLRGNAGFIEKWFLPVFLIPFLLIGLLLIYMVFHSLLALFNPRVRVRLSTGRLTPGLQLEVEWRVEGRHDRLERLTVHLEGREEATYSQGTRTYTDKSVFAKVPVAEVAAGADMRSGRASLTIPEEAMPTFEATHNKILWSIHVRGVIRRWPDVEDELGVEILPKPTHT